MKTREEEIADQLVQQIERYMPAPIWEQVHGEGKTHWRKVLTEDILAAFEAVKTQSGRRVLQIDWRLFLTKTMIDDAYNQGVLAALGLIPVWEGLSGNYILTFRDEAESKRVAALLRVPK